MGYSCTMFPKEKSKGKPFMHFPTRMIVFCFQCVLLKSLVMVQHLVFHSEFMMHFQ